MVPDPENGPHPDGGIARGDLERATQIAHFLVEISGMGGDGTGLRQYRNLQTGERLGSLSPEQLAALDRQVNEIVRAAQERAARILKENRALLETLRDLLLEKKVLDAKALGAMVSESKVDEVIARSKVKL